MWRKRLQLLLKNMTYTNNRRRLFIIAFRFDIASIRHLLVEFNRRSNTFAYTFRFAIVLSSHLIETNESSSMRSDRRMRCCSFVESIEICSEAAVLMQWLCRCRVHPRRSQILPSLLLLLLGIFEVICARLEDGIKHEITSLRWILKKTGNSNIFINLPLYAATQRIKRVACNCGNIYYFRISRDYISSSIIRLFLGNLTMMNEFVWSDESISSRTEYRNKRFDE